jgi:DNA-binding SARP family transcriptional activator
MGILKISLFGVMRVVNNSRQEEIKLTRTISLLLAYLLLERHRMHSREVLAGLFWGDHSQERARNCLNTALWRLRRSLESQEFVLASYLLATEGEVGFNRESDYWLDVAVFEERLTKIFKQSVDQVDTEEIMQVESALQLYRGDLLEGVYEDWALRAREQTRLLYLKGLMYLMHYYEHQKSYSQALEFGRKILDADPLREEIHREVMRLYLLNGQRAMAIQQYETCRQNLADELGLTPMEETERIYRQILAASANQSSPSTELSAQGAYDGWQTVMQQIHQASRNLDLAREQFNQALQYLEVLLERHF